MNKNDMIFNREGGKITAGGWNVNSDLLQNDFPLAANSQVGGGTGVIQNLAVPAGLIILQNMIDSNTKSPLNSLLEEPRVIGEDLYDKLLNLAGRKKRTQHSTRKNRSKTKRKTRKK
jgi:hypothetical protein|tara:strand:+ start:1367 stop:1717 length:351 start_codon:yes stop_codon:yes gene_type:complete